jgi:adenine/guanine phosphoribosyltransferase-like PRPP-binding protein
MGEMVDGRYRVRIGTQSIDLPIVAIDGELAIALLMTIDVGVRFLAQAGTDLAALIAGAQPEIVVSAATLGIPVAIEVSRALGLDDYLILQKTAKLHLRDALSEPLSSITTEGAQRLLLDRARIAAVAGRRVALVDDVVSTGASMAACLRLLRAAGAEVVVIGVLLQEGEGWRDAFGGDAGLLRSLGTVPLFRPDGVGEWTER